MTNAQIVLIQRMNLMEAGIIGTTGRQIEIETDEGKKVIMEPEEIHTFAAWKAKGYMVKKGSKAVAQFPIWKYREKKGTMPMKNVETGNVEDVEFDDSKMFMKKASWFTAAQVEKIA